MRTSDPLERTVVRKKKTFNRVVFFFLSLSLSRNRESRTCFRTRNGRPSESQSDGVVRQNSGLRNGQVHPTPTPPARNPIKTIRVRVVGVARAEHAESERPVGGDRQTLRDPISAKAAGTRGRDRGGCGRRVSEKSACCKQWHSCAKASHE